MSAESPRLPDDAEGMCRLRDRALAALRTHIDQEGMCEGCLAEWARLAPYPCEQARWAAAVMNRYGTAEPPETP